MDIEAAKSLLNGATPEMRILYNRDNPNNAQAFALIRESATGQASGPSTADSARRTGARIGQRRLRRRPLRVEPTPASACRAFRRFPVRQRLQLQQFSDPDADKLMDQLVGTTDRSKQEDLMRRSTRRSGARLRPSAVPTVGVIAYSNRITGVKFMPNGPVPGGTSGGRELGQQ